MDFIKKYIKIGNYILSKIILNAFFMVKIYYVYILRCTDSQEKRTRTCYYVGITNDLRKRDLQHKSAHDKKTKRFKGKVQMVYIEKMEAQTTREANARAWKREKQIRQWTDEKIEGLIRSRQRKTGTFTERDRDEW